MEILEREKPGFVSPLPSTFTAVNSQEEIQEADTIMSTVSEPATKPEVTSPSKRRSFWPSLKKKQSQATIDLPDAKEPSSIANEEQSPQSS